MFILLTGISLAVFNISSLTGFYVIFELRLVPIVIIIIGWGYQPERLNASLALLLYTIAGSLPLLLVIITISTSCSSSMITLQVRLGARLSRVQILVTIALITGFLVKLPIFIVHIWLPKAHVEAPVAGSIYLAAVLLKLGGLGLLRVRSIIGWNLFLLIVLLFSSNSLLWIGILCSTSSDIKTIIAYSSVAHIGLALLAACSITLEGMLAAALVFITHGASSSFMFMQSFFIYTRSQTRSILLTQNSLNWSGGFSLSWFMACIGILGAPPSANILAEISAIISIIRFSKLLRPFLIGGALLAGAYRLGLFSFVYHCKSFKRSLRHPASLIETSSIVFHLYWIVITLILIPWILLYTFVNLFNSI